MVVLAATMRRLFVLLCVVGVFVVLVTHENTLLVANTSDVAHKNTLLLVNDLESELPLPAPEQQPWEEAKVAPPSTVVGDWLTQKKREAAQFPPAAAQPPSRRSTTSTSTSTLARAPEGSPARGVSASDSSLARAVSSSSLIAGRAAA